jgi:cytochrome c-type biogenesis protein
VQAPGLVLLAFAAGVLSFSSPCALPLVPGYLGYMSGVSASRGRTLFSAAVFVAGFALVFTALGATASAAATLLAGHRQLLDRVAGVVIVGLGLFLLGLIRFPALMREGRPLLARVRPGPEGALLLGIAFAFGWTPCIGPILGAILALASTSGTASQGAALLLVYSLGLGLPFLLAALFIDRFRAVSGWVRRRAQVIDAVGGVLLVGMGALVFSERLNAFLAPALDLYARLRWPPI